VREPGEVQLAIFQGRAFALGGASPGRSGATQSLLALRQVLAVGCRALVIPEQVTVPNAEQAFDEMDELKDSRAAGQLKTVVRKLIEYTRMFGG
jgi:chromate reductase, NAD(P)H dehydrogenase (quinone)